MLNLMKKDLIIQKTQLMVFIPLILVFVNFADNFSPIFILILTSIFIPMNAFMYDEQAESNILLNSLPYTRKEIVASRYVGGIVYLILTMGVVAGVMYFFDFSFGIRDIVIAAILSLIIFGLAFPFFYIIKPGYIGIVALVGIIVSAIIYQPVLDFLSENLTSLIDFVTSFSTSTIYLGSAGIAIVLYLISWLVSQLIYQRKTF